MAIITFNMPVGLNMKIVADMRQDAAILFATKVRSKSKSNILNE